MWLVAIAAVSGCGYTDSDMQLVRDRVTLLQRLLDACETHSRATSARLRDCSTAAPSPLPNEGSDGGANAQQSPR